MLLHAFSLLLTSAIAGCQASIGPVANLEIVSKVISPDGFNRSATLAGGTFPGTLIKANMGDHFMINVTDSLTDPTMFRSTSVHWHGISQPHTNYNDGVSFVTQCPIVPEHSYLYNFTAPGQAGTFWYHSHLGLQYCDGLRGPLIIYDPNDPNASLYDVDDESTIITLADWFHTPIMSAGMFALPDATLINGLGRYAGGDPEAPLAVINVQPGKRYRMRLISMACHPNFNFTIDGHNMTIIEADGGNTQPLTVNFIQILAGQRYSFILNAAQPIDNYWIRANTSKGPSGFDNGINSAILRYEGANISEPTTSPIPTTEIVPLKESNLRRLDQTLTVPGTPELGAADVNLFFDLTFNETNFFVNGTMYMDPDFPVLLQILSGMQKATDLLPLDTIFTLPRNKVIEMTLPGNLAGGPHPFHLHGHSFDVVQNDGAPPNFVDPVRRDTFFLGVESTTIRWVTDNPGPWFFHCHIDFHLAYGLAFIFAEDPLEAPAYSPVTDAWKELCPTYQALNPDNF